MKAEGAGEHVFLAVLFVSEHVERPVARAELEHAGAFHRRAGLDGVERILDHRRAGKCPDQPRLSGLAIGQDGAHRRLRFPPLVCDVIGLGAVQFAGLIVRQRSAGEEDFRSKFLVGRRPGDEPVICPRDVGDLRHRRLVAAGQRDAGVGDVVQIEQADLLPAQGHEQVGLVVLLADREARGAGGRIDGEVENLDAVRLRADLRGEARVDAREFGGELRRTGLLRRLHGENLRTCAVAEEEHALGAELDDIDALDRGLAVGGFAEHAGVRGNREAEGKNEREEGVHGSINGKMLWQASDDWRLFGWLFGPAKEHFPACL